MKYGYFDDSQKEYVINTPKTPYPWINYLGSQRYFSIISNTGGDIAFIGCKVKKDYSLQVQ